MDVTDRHGVQELAVASQSGNPGGIELLDDLGMLLKAPERVVAQRLQILGIILERVRAVGARVGTWIRRALSSSSPNVTDVPPDPL
jgi:hypothetical protein